MGRSKELTPAIRERICELHAINWGYKRIHQRYPMIALSTIRYTIKKEPERREGVSKPRSGRPKKSKTVPGQVAKADNDPQASKARSDPTAAHDRAGTEETPNTAESESQKDTGPSSQQHLDHTIINGIASLSQAKGPPDLPQPGAEGLSGEPSASSTSSASSSMNVNM